MDSPSPDAPATTLDENPSARNDLFDALSHARRRFVLQHLRASDAPVSVTDLADELVAWEGDSQAADRQTRVEVSLRHVHLPKLADTGLVEYDETGRLVALADDSDELHSLLQAAADHEER